MIKTVALSLLSNTVSAVLLVIVNKKLVTDYNFSYMTVLTGFHAYFAFIACCFMLLLGSLQYRTVKCFQSLLLISIGSLLSIVFMNLSLASNSIGLYQMSKLACIPMTLLIEYILNRQSQVFTFALMSSLSLITVGVGIVAFVEVEYSSIGIVWATLGCLSTSLAQIYFNAMKNKLNLDPIQLLLHTSPLLTFGSFTLSYLFEQGSMVDIKLTIPLLTGIFISCFCAFFLNVTNYVVLGMLTPLSYQVLGHMKTIIIIAAASVCIEGSSLDTKSASGASLAMVGIVFYTLENNRQRYLLINDDTIKGTTTITAVPTAVSVGDDRISIEITKEIVEN